MTPLVALQAYLSKAGREVTGGGHLPAMLGVFQKLLSSRAQDQHGFQLLGAMLQHLGLDPLKPYMTAVRPASACLDGLT